MAVMGDDALVGRVLDGRYLVGERIARGGMASVFKATDQRLGREVAIKVMHHGLGDEATFTQRFEREAQAAAQLNHRHVVSVFDQGTDGEITYLVMEYVPGPHAPRPHARRDADEARAGARAARRRCSWPCPPRTRPTSSTATSSPRTC